MENIDIRETESIFEIVDCLNSKVYGDAAMELIRFLDKLPDSSTYNYLRTLTVPYLFHIFERNLLKDEDPSLWFEKELDKLRNQLIKTAHSDTFFQLIDNGMEEETTKKTIEEVKKHTGKHYGNLFRDFDHIAYFEEAKSLLELRLKRNKLNIENLDKLSLLDQGCGGGRYTAAWKLLGVNNAIGIDYSEIGINDAIERIKFSGLDNIRFDIGSVLDMPYEDESFDIVFSNGVLHHTEDWKRGIAEQLRVIKSQGYGWLYLIENPGGIFWDKIEILRAIMKNVDKAFAQRILKSLNIPSNRVFYMLDHVMVPINTRLTPEEIEIELSHNGAIDIQRMKRGADFDRIEYIHQKIPFSKKKFGVGENRYFFRKK